MGRNLSKFMRGAGQATADIAGQNVKEKILMEREQRLNAQKKKEVTEQRVYNEKQIQDERAFRQSEAEKNRAHQEKIYKTRHGDNKKSEIQRQYEALIQMGYSEDDARDMSSDYMQYGKKTPPSDWIRMRMTELQKRTSQGGKGLDRETALAEAKSEYQQSQTAADDLKRPRSQGGQTGKGGKGWQPGDDQINKVLEANPGWDRDKAVRYIKHLYPNGMPGQGNNTDKGSDEKWDKTSQEELDNLEQMNMELQKEIDERDAQEISALADRVLSIAGNNGASPDAGSPGNMSRYMRDYRQSKPASTLTS